MQIPQLTFTRFLASMAIVILHFGLFNWPMNTRYISQLGGDLIGGITYFFVLSGFILVVSNCKNNSLPVKIARIPFWKRRFARIYPVYLLAVLIFFLLVFKYDPTIPLVWQIKSYAYSLFLTQSWNYKMALDINYPAWSLSVEAFFYLIFPWLFANINRLKNTLILILAILAWYLNLLAVDNLIENQAPKNFIKFFPLLHVSTFIVGVCAGILFARNLKLLQEQRIKIYVLVTLIGVYVIWGMYRNYPDYERFQNNGYLSIFFALFIIALSLFQGKMKSILAWKPLEFLGEISYSIYLFQFVVLLLCKQVVPGMVGKENTEIFWPYVLILLVFSTVVYLFFEKPMRRLIMRKNKSN